MRMLMMFGPMLMRQFQKFQKKKAREADQNPTQEAPKKNTEKDFV